MRLTPLAVLANLLNVLLVVWATWDGAPPVFLVAWGVAVLAVMQCSMGVWAAQRGHRPRETASPRALRNATVQASLLAALWAALPLVVFPGASAEQQLLVASVVTGMICAGGFALATLPQGGVAYVLTLGVGAAGALASSGLRLAPVISALPLVYCAIVIASVRSTGR